ncbi:hypothetical protein FPOA_03943 [Fusarium poae]|uniref:Uncharacterized protein n=1 Tax=Fusarium poae TaxID=36050 RepID=A0A1B8AS94_FUSPO|nr:hypothetical protein FPOA_03943 [Fusarium poae]
MTTTTSIDELLLIGATRLPWSPRNYKRELKACTPNRGWKYNRNNFNVPPASKGRTRPCFRVIGRLLLFSGEPDYVLCLSNRRVAMVMMIKNATTLYLLPQTILVRGVAFHTLTEQTVLALQLCLGR